MKSTHDFRLVARNEEVRYRDAAGTYYWFDVVLKQDTWTVFLPARKGEIGHVVRADSAEVDPIIPFLIEFLAGIKWFGLFGGPFKVEIQIRS